MTVKASSERIESERQMQAEAFALIESQLVASGLFNPESVPAMISAIRANSPPFTPVNAHLLLGKKGRPEAEAARISLADCLVSASPPSADPATFIQAACTHSANLARNRHALIRMKGIGIEAVRVTFVKDKGSCAKVKKLTKSYPINDAPVLPLQDCNGKRCFCAYKAIIPGLDD
ncbi:hypothetical protein [Paraburkholderia saeva]|nr:hypothetical protein [Paraburkholderia saeva]